MIFGRIILVGSIYYNKIIDCDQYSYFVACNKTTNVFIKIATANLDKKSYIYSNKVIQAASNLLSKLIDLETLLEYTPFIKGVGSKRKNYYLENKMKKNNHYSVEKKVGLIFFD